MSSGIPYADWPVIEEATFDGWKFGTRMSYVDEKWGDAFVEAPDGSRCGLVWVLGDRAAEQILAPDADRRGIYKIGFSRPMKDVQDLVENFHSALPQLRRLHQSVKG